MPPSRLSNALELIPDAICVDVAATYVVVVDFVVFVVVYSVWCSASLL